MEHGPAPRLIQVSTAIGSQPEARALAEEVIGKRLAACAQIIGPITSVYWWKGAMETAEEWLCLFKTLEDQYARLEAAIRATHPYETPEIIATPVIAVDQGYLAWCVAELALAADE
jgi:periplasmic divalent cation tolerance protein